MKEIKAFVPASRAADVLEALKEAEEAGAGVLNLAAFPVEGLPRAGQYDPEAAYSVTLAETVIRQVKVEVLCRNDEAPKLIAIIKRAAGTGNRQNGWLIVTAIEAANPIAAFNLPVIDADA